MCSHESRTPRWPERLKELCQELQSTPDDPGRQPARAEAWLLLNSSISRYLRVHASRMGSVPIEDIEDIAAEKSLDLIRKIETGENDMASHLPAEIATYLSRVAKNGLLDRLREAARQVNPVEEDRLEWDLGGAETEVGVSGSDPPDLLIEQREFAGALTTCAGKLAPRSRLIWLLRVFSNLSSKQIATHPEVGLKVSHVDVLLQRARQAIRTCMQRLGHNPEDMSPGILVELWRAFRLDEMPIVKEQ